MAEDFSRRSEIDFTIDNDIWCVPPYSEEVIFDWRNTSDTLGWTGTFNVTDVSTIGGELSGYVYTTGGNPYIETPTPKMAITPSSNRIDIALRVKSAFSTKAKIQFLTNSNDDPDPDVIAGLGQELEFDLIADGNYHIYKLDPTPLEAWQGLVDRLRIFPGIGANPGDSFYIQYIRVMTKTDVLLCQCDPDEFFYDAPNPCTGTGRAASIEGRQTGQETIAIGSWNDKLKIRTNGSGWRILTLPHTQNNINSSIVAGIIEREINKLSSYGFENVKLRALPNTAFRLEGGIRGVDSSIELEYSSDSVLKTLGFFDPAGMPTYTAYPGVDDEHGFDFYTVSNKELKSIREGTNVNALTIAPDDFVVEMGNQFFGDPEFGSDFDGRNQTMIDLMRPANASGFIDTIKFYGTVFKSPRSKVKIFRPTESNGLKFINEWTLEPVADHNSLPKIKYPEIPYNQQIFLYKVEEPFYVREGDVLALSNVYIYSHPVVNFSVTQGEDGGDPLEEFGRTFVRLDGDVTWDIDDIDNADVYGQGFLSLPVYAHSFARRRKTALFIDLGEKKAVDKIAFNYKVAEFVKNTSSLASQISSVSVDTKGSTHSHWRYIATFSGLEQVTESHTTSAFNKGLLIDGVKEAYQGDDSTYFYLDGDGDLTNVDFEAPGIVQNDSFSDDEFHITINLSQNLEKSIGTIVFWFVKPVNWKEWGMFYMKGSSKIPFEIQNVMINNHPILSAENIFKNNPFQSENYDEKVVIDNIIGSQGVGRQKMEFNVKPVTTKTVVFEVYKHYDTKMSEIELLSTEAITEDGFEVSGSDMFTVYAADETLDFKPLDFFTAEAAEFGEIMTSTMDVGRPVRYLRIEIEPVVVMDIFNIRVLSEKKDHLTPREPIVDNYLKSTTEETALVIDYFADRKVEIENLLDVTADLEVNILKDDSSEQREMVLYSKLDSRDSLENPDIGPSAQFDFDSDYLIKVRYDVAQGRPSYGAYSLNFNHHGASNWQALGTKLTDGGSFTAVGTASGFDETDVSEAPLYNGDVVTGGSYDQTFDITYTVHIDITSGNEAGNGSGAVPTFTVTSVPSVDDNATPVEILDYGVFYPVGSLGVQIKWEDVDYFGENDAWSVTATANANFSSSVNASEYGYTCVDLGDHYYIDDIVLQGTTQRVGNEYYSWVDAPQFQALSPHDTPKVTGPQYGDVGLLSGPARWVRVDYDFTQGQRGGYLNNIQVFVETEVMYSDDWWLVEPLNGGAVSVDEVNHSSRPIYMRSLKFDYRAPGESVTFYLDDCEMDSDPLWSFRDFLEFYINVPDSSGIESFQLQFGTDSSNYYSWEVPILSKHNGLWVGKEVQFEDGTIVGEPELYNSINHMAIVVSGTSNFSFNLDTLKMRRNKFDEDFQYGKGLYLSNNEFVLFSPISELTLRQGSMDFWLSPDWDSDGEFERIEYIDENQNIAEDFKYYFDERKYANTVFALLGGVDFKAELIAQGFGLGGVQLVTNNYMGDREFIAKLPSFTWYDGPHHIGVSWKYNPLLYAIELRLYFDGELSKGILTPWIPTREDSTTIVLGGRADSSFSALLPKSVNGAIRNLRVYNFWREDYADLMKVEFEETLSELRANDLYRISVNDSGFVKYGEGSLPLIVEGVAPGEKVNLDVRYAKPSGKIPSNMPRRARVELKWRP